MDKCDEDDDERGNEAIVDGPERRSRAKNQGGECKNGGNRPHNCASDPPGSPEQIQFAKEEERRNRDQEPDRNDDTLKTERSNP